MKNTSNVTLFQLLELLSEESYLVPLSKNVEYNRLTPKKIDTFNLFIANDDEVLARTSDLVFNKSRLNLNVQYRINGKVNLNPIQAEKIGLPEVIESHIYRNYAIVKNGKLNVNEIEVLIPTEVFVEKFTNMNLKLIEKTRRFDKDYVRCLIDLKDFKIIDEEVEVFKTENDVFKNVFETYKAEVRQKIINYYIDKIESVNRLKKTGALKEFTVDQIKLLEEHGLDKNLCYKGIKVTEVNENKKTEEMLEISFGIDKCLSIPKIEDLFNALNTGKKLTPSLKIMSDEYTKIEKYIEGKASFSVINAALRDALLLKLKEVKLELKKLRNEMAEFKLRYAITGEWYDNMKLFTEKYEGSNGYCMTCKVCKKSVEVDDAE